MYNREEIDSLVEFISSRDGIADKTILATQVQKQFAIDKNKHISTRLCSMYNQQLLSGTRIIKHWAGRNSRGVTQYDGKSLEEIVFNFNPDIDTVAAQDFLTKCLLT